MKKVLVRIFSVLLILVCIMGITFGAMNIGSILDTKAYWEQVKAEALESFDMADGGIAQLKENEQIYVDGVETAEAGKEKLKEGGDKLYASVPVYNQNAMTLAEAHEAYNAAIAQLEAGKAQLAAAEQQLADNAQAYEEGKATLARVQPLYNLCMGHYNAWQAKLAEYNAAVEAGETVKAGALKLQCDAMEATYRAGVSGMTMEDIVAQYNAGLAQIQTYEAGLAAAEQARIDIAAGEAAAAAAQEQLAANDQKLADAKGALDQGHADYEKGKNTLLEGLKKLSVFEGGQAQIAEGLDTILSTPTYFYKNGEPIVMSIADRMGEGFCYYKLDEAGEILVLNGNKAVDLDKAAAVVLAGREFVDDTEVAVTHECMGRVYATLLLLAASVLGLAAGIVGLFAKGTAAGILSAITVLLSVAGIIIDGVMNSMSYPLSEIAQCSAPGRVLAGLFTLLAAALLLTVMGFICGSAKKAPKAAPAAAAPAAAAAAPAESEALLIARADAERARAEAEKAKAEAEKAKAELELAKLKAAAAAVPEAEEATV